MCMDPELRPRSIECKGFQCDSFWNGEARDVLAGIHAPDIDVTARRSACNRHREQPAMSRTCQCLSTGFSFNLKCCFPGGKTMNAKNFPLVCWITSFFGNPVARGAP